MCKFRSLFSRTFAQKFAKKFVANFARFHDILRALLLEQRTIYARTFAASTIIREISLAKTINFTRLSTIVCFPTCRLRYGIDCSTGQSTQRKTARKFTHIETIDIAKMRRDVANCRRNFISSKISSNSHERREFSSKFVCITFSQYCIQSPAFNPVNMVLWLMQLVDIYCLKYS